MLGRSWIVLVLLIGLILPVHPHATARSIDGGPQQACELAPCFKDQIKSRLQCSLAPPSDCDGCMKPGFAVALLIDNKPFFEDVSGFANIRLRQRINRETVFDIASLTKQFTAAGILMLLDDPSVTVKGNRLTLDTLLSDIFDGFPDYTKTITVADLLTHQSNLREYINLYDEQHHGSLGKALKKRGPPFWYEQMDHRTPNEEVTNESVLRMIKAASPKRAIPGTDFIYSNSGYVVLAQIIEKLSVEKSYKKFMQDRIFTPLQMTKTTVFDETSPRIPGHAFSYVRSNQKYIALDGYTPLNFVHGDGNIHSTLVDMVKWVQAINEVAHGRREDFIKQATLLKAFESQRVRLDLRRHSDYGFGFYVAQKDQMRIVYHPGDWPGFHSYMLYGRRGNQGCELTMIVLSNFEPDTNDPSKNRPCHLGRELSKVFWGEHEDLKIILAEEKMFCGSEPNPNCGALPGCTPASAR